MRQARITPHQAHLPITIGMGRRGAAHHTNRIRTATEGDCSFARVEGPTDLDPWAWKQHRSEHAGPSAASCPASPGIQIPGFFNSRTPGSFMKRLLAEIPRTLLLHEMTLDDGDVVFVFHVWYSCAEALGSPPTGLPARSIPSRSGHHADEGDHGDCEGNHRSQEHEQALLCSSYRGPDNASNA